MGGKKRTGSAGKAPKVEVDPEVAAKAHETKAEGDKLFVKKEFAKAMEAYASAASLLPEGAAERAELLGAKAACLYAQRRWRDSARECSAALAVPGAGAAGAKALLRRAHCYEHLALYKQALSDAQAYNRTELSTEESKRLEQRLRAALQGGAARGPSLARGGGATTAAAANGAQAAAAARAQQQQQPPRPPAPAFLAAKVTLQGEGDKTEARLVQLPVQAMSYAALRAAVAEKFGPLLANKPFLLKYKDGSGAPVTITCREDVAQAMTALLANNPEAVRRLSLSGGVAPPFDVTAVVVADAAEVPPVPSDEEKAREIFERHARLVLARELKRQAEVEAELDKHEAGLAAAAAQQQAQQEQQQQAGQQQEVQFDDWLLEFYEIFRDMSQIDPDAHAEALNDGWELTGRAMAATLRCDAALPLLAKAQDRFAEVTALGLTHWGNVHVNIAHKLADDAAPAAAEAARAPGVADTNEARAKAAKPALAAAAKKAGAELDAAEKRYQEALKYKPDFFDALAAMGQLEFERAKLRAGLAVVTPVPGAAAGAAAEGGDNNAEAAEGEAATAEAKTGGAAEVTPAAAEALREALRRISPGDVSSAKKHYDAAAKWFEKARQAGAAADAQRVADAEAARRRAGASEGGAAAAAAEEADSQQLSPEASVESQALIMSGNVAYEWSQLLGAVAGDAPGAKGAAEAGKAWRAALDDATARFREAKCSEADVRAALKNHTRAADLDLGPDPEPEVVSPRPEDEVAAASDKAEPAKPAAKGLPSLEVKGKKKADAGAAAKA